MNVGRKYGMKPFFVVMVTNVVEGYGTMMIEGCQLKVIGISNATVAMARRLITTWL